MKFWRSKSTNSHKFRERRLDTRKPATIDAVVYCQKDMTPCVISSLSLTGMFLKLEEQTHFEVGTMLQLIFYSTMDYCKKLCFEWVRVAGMRENGVAVSFTQFDNQHQINIQQMLHQAVAHSPAYPLAVSTGQTGLTNTEHPRKSA